MEQQQYHRDGKFRDRYYLGANASTLDSFREFVSLSMRVERSHGVYTVCIYIYIYVEIQSDGGKSIGGAKGSKRKKGNAKELELERAGLGEREKRERRTVGVGTPHRRYVLLLRGGCCSITSIDACSFIPRNNR